MNEIKALLHNYRVIEERVIVFIIQHSGVEYVQESDKVVEGGAFAWTSLGAEHQILQDELWSDYVTISESARERLQQADSQHLADFDLSCERVRSFIKQDDVLLVSTLEAAAEAAKIELDLQKYLIAQPYHAILSKAE
ncbi:hypothetical protein C2I18_21425 [Paenibacillus sp. PK3_47]|uniref:hypothetical protein n=1 Tax=Paenibacillus sp. PK3_47 TaxID=2072642 RepID=UPI00201E436B|nr:hypothetical protein [Paenibacillus sp. PK3_47]UQZ35867.1 hypothetical protein C2I18_21425 [Paenibacillus sp. PK3_47]